MHLLKSFFVSISIILISSTLLFAEEVIDIAAAPSEPPISLSAPTIEYFGDRFKASGGVVIDNGPLKMKANEAEYSINPASGQLTDVSFTTCTEIKPHYHLTARSISLSPYGTIRAKKVGLFIGNHKLFTIPILIFRAGGGKGNKNSILPVPGYSKTDGLTLTYNLVLIDNDRLYLRTSPKFTSKNGMQGGVEADYGLNGVVAGINDRTLKYESLKDIAFDIEPEKPVSEPVLPIKTASLKANAIYSLTSEQNQFELNNVNVYRRPEIRLSYTSKNISFINTKSINNYIPHPNITLTYGRYSESPNIVGNINKSMIEAELPITALTIGNKSAFTPFVAQRWGEYSNSNNYNVFTYGIDFIKMFDSGSRFDFRYLNRKTNGETPFRFDKIKVDTEIQSALQIWKNNYVIGFASAYDIDRNKIYDWEVMAGKRLDCLSFDFRWNNRLRKFGFDLSLLGF